MTRSIRYEKFTGINNKSPLERLKRTELREAVNVDIDQTRRVRRRRGYQKVYSGTNIHSLWSGEGHRLFVENGALKELHSDYSTTTYRTGLNLSARMAYAGVAGRVYYTNGEITGCIFDGADHAWGVEPPHAAPAVAPAPGAFKAGKYQLVFTYRTKYQEESGSSAPTPFELAADGGMQLSNLPKPQDPDVTTLLIYITPPNGDQFYYAGSVPAGTDTTLLQGAIYTVPLRTQFLQPPPPGTLLEVHAGRIYIGDGPVVWYTEPGAFGLLRPSRNFLQFEDTVDLLAATIDGMFVSADQTYFLHGTDPEQMWPARLASYKAIRGTVAEVDGALIGDGSSPGVHIMWLSERGICAAGQGGSFENLTEKRLSAVTGGAGAGLLRRDAGAVQYLGLTQDTTPPGEGGNLYATDTAVAEVVRNGITI